MNSSTASGALSLYSSTIIEPLDVFKTYNNEEEINQVIDKILYNNFN